MSTSVAGVTTNFFPDAENGFTTTLASTISSGATTVPLNSVAGYTNGMPAVFVVDPSDLTKKQTFTGIIDTAGVQVTNVVWTAGTNQSHTGGATVVDYVTATHMAMVTKGLTTAIFDQDGTMKAGAVDNAAALASNVVTTAKILDGNVTEAKLSTSAIYLGSTTKTTDFLTTATTSEVAITGFTLAITVPTTSRKIRITVSVASVTNGSGTGTDTTLRLKDGSTTLLDRTFSAPNNTRTPCPSMVWEGTLTAGAHTLAVYAQNTGAFDVRYDFSSNNTGLLEALVI